MASIFNYTSGTFAVGRRCYKFTLTGAGLKYLFAYTDGEATAIANRVATDLSDTVSVAPALVSGYYISTADGNKGND